MTTVQRSAAALLASPAARIGALVAAFFDNYVRDGTGSASAGGGRDQLSTATKAKAVVFTLLVALFALFILAGFSFMIRAVVLNWLPDAAVLSFRPELGPEDLTHRLHSTALSVLLWGMVIGTAVQLHRPRRKVAPMLMAIAVPVAIALSEVLAGTYTVMGTAPLFVPLLVIGLLHPEARALVRRPDLDRDLGVLVAVAAVPLLAYAYGQAELHRLTGPADPHTQMGHWVFMITLALLILLWGAIAATDHPGWRLTAWAAGVAAATLALQSLLFPEVASTVPALWAVIALAWAVAFVLAAERRRRS